MKKNIWRIVALLVIVSMVMAACGPTPEPTQPPPPPTDAPKEEPTEAPKEEPTEAPKEEPTKEAEPEPEPEPGGPVDATPGQEVNMVLLPKFLGILPFDQANDGAQEAHEELGNTGELQFLGPTPENSVAGQIEIVTTAATQGMDAIMISNNAGDQIAPAAQEARDAGMTVVTWDSPIPSAEGEQIFVAQVDFDETGTVMADMALSILGGGGKFAVLSASPDAANQNAWIAALEEVLKEDKYASLELLDIVYGNDQSEDSYNQALALVDKYPDMGLIMAPTTVGIAAAAKAMQDEGLCDTVKTSGLGLPAEMVSYTLNDCAPEFALWSFVDLGYLTYHVSYLLATGAIEGVEGESFNAGRMGTYTIEKDPTRDAGLRVLMGPFKVYDASNVEAEAGPQAEEDTGAPVVAEPGANIDLVLLPKFLGILPFDQANDGAQEAHGELGNTGELQFLGPTPENSVAGQIEIVTTAATQGMDGIMISNNAGDQIAPAAVAAREAGMTVVTWDSPIPSAEGEQIFVAQVDFDETGTVMADMALSILGGGGKFAVLSASPDAANQNAWIAALEEVLQDDKYASLELLDIVYGNDQSEDSYNQALALVDKYPDMGLIMAPTTVGIAAAAKAMQDEGLCEEVKVSGLGLPAEMVSYTLNGCAPEFALWSFVDLGYLTYYVSYLLSTGAIEGKVGERFEAGRMGTYAIEKDPTRDAGLRVLMGPFKVYDASNVEAEAGPQAEEDTGAPVVAEPGANINLVLLPKFLGILPFDQANDGAQEAHGELGNTGELQFLGPTPENSVAGQIEIVTTAATQGMDGIMISNNAGDQIAPAAVAAREAGMTVVTWDSPIPSAEGEQIFVAQVDFDETGTVMADMALSILGGGGKFAVLSASPDAANQNAWIAALEEVLQDDKYASLELLDIVYGNDQSEDSYNQALALVDKYPDLGLIMAPTTVGIAAAAKAMQDEGLCEEVKVSGLGLPAEMVSYTLNGCAPEFALWSFVDLGYLTYYVSYLLSTGAIEGKVGERFEAGRMGTYAIEKDPTRDAGLRVLMGPFKVYDASNVEAEAGPQEQAEGSVVTAEPGQELNLVLLPKFLGILPFDQANNGAQEAHAEVQNPGELQFLGPTPENSVAGQIEIVTTAATQGMDGIMISNNAGDQIAPAAVAAREAGMTVVTWDSPIPSAEGEQIFVAQVDFDETGTVMADMALSVLGGGGKFAVLSASPDAANQNAWIAALEKVLQDDKYASLELLDIVYGNDQSEDSYNQALALVDKYPDLGLIMAPTTVGIAAAAKAMQDEGLCETVKVSGLGLPAEMVSYTLNGCAPEFALWSFVDLGYLSYYVTYLLGTGAIEGKVGERFEAGRMGTYTIEKDPTRDAGLRVLMGPFTVYDKDNVEAASK